MEVQKYSETMTKKPQKLIRCCCPSTQPSVCLFEPKRPINIRPLELDIDKTLTQWNILSTHKLMGQHDFAQNADMTN